MDIVHTYANTDRHSPPQFAHQVLLFLFLGHFKSLPGLVDVCDESSLRGNVRGSVAQTELRLEGVEVRLQVALLLGLGWLGDGGVLTELLEAALSVLEGVLGNTITEPGHGLGNPLQQLKEKEGGGGGGWGRERGELIKIYYANILALDSGEGLYIHCSRV